MVEAALFDPFTFEQDGVEALELDVGGSEIIEALVVWSIIVVLDEGCDLGLEVLLEEVTL
jgi:hypothetical protein